MTELSYHEKLTFWLEIADRGKKFERTENPLRHLYDWLPSILLVGAFVGFVCGIAALIGGIPLRKLVTIFASIITIIFMALLLIVLNYYENFRRSAARLKALLPLSRDDLARIEDYFEYQKECISKLLWVACLTLPGGIFILLSKPSLMRLMVSLLILVVLPLLITLAYLIYSFLRQRYARSDPDKIPEIRRFISAEAFGAICLSMVVTAALIPMHILLDICIYYASSTYQSDVTDVLTLGARVLNIISFVCWCPVVVFAAVITWVPLPLVMGKRALWWYISAVIALSILIAIPVHISLKVIGIVAYLSTINYLTTPQSASGRARIKLVALGAAGIAAGLGLGIAHTIVGIGSLSFAGATLAIASAVLIDIVLC